MTRLDGRFDRLDPVDRDAPEPDGEPLLREILRASAAPAPRARRRVGPRTGLAGAAAVAAAGAFLALPGPAGPNVVAAAYDALLKPGTILHYEQRWTAPGSGVAPRQVLETTEVWQTSDGARLRWLMRLDGGRTVDSVLSSEEMRSSDAEGARIDELPGFTIDFLSFEILPATAVNERRLRMSPHPGARIVDGDAVDAAEARRERR